MSEQCWPPPPTSLDCAVAEDKRVLLFSIKERWLVDTGCGLDLVSLKTIPQNYRELLIQGAPINFNTANGPWTADKRLPISTPPMGAGTAATPYCMADTPAVLSVGLRCNHHGYSFFWLRGRTPAFVTPDGTIIPLDVSNDCPYVRKGGLWESVRDRSRIERLTGVSVKDGYITLKQPLALAGFPHKKGETLEIAPAPAEPPPLLEGDGDLEPPVLEPPAGADGSDTGGEPMSEPGGESEAESEPEYEPVRRDLRAESLSLCHWLLHKKGLPLHCEPCTVGKKRQVQGRKGRKRWPKEFGEIVTFCLLYTSPSPRD